MTYKLQLENNLCEISSIQQSLEDIIDKKQEIIRNQQYEEAARLRDMELDLLKRITRLEKEKLEIEDQIVKRKEDGWAAIHGRKFGV